MTPDVLRSGPYRVGFFAGDRVERAHVHVRRDNLKAKFWLTPAVELASYTGFSQQELRRVQRLIEEHGEDLRRHWHDFFG